MEEFKHFIALKQQYYKEFEFDTVSRAYGLIKNHIKRKKVIHIVGTNGKGSTGKALSVMLHNLNQTVTHYSSPHLLKYNERICINGNDISDEKLNYYHNELKKYLCGLEETLSYFEYFTLLALLVSNESDFLVLEAGLGGEFDATNVIQSDITVLTPVGLDHQQFLGTSIAKIATTKMKACDNLLVVAKQEDEQVYEIADFLYPNNKKVAVDDDFFIKGFLGENIQCATTVLELLGFEFSKELLSGFKMKGRNQQIEKNIIVDVGHNPLGAKALVKTIQNGTVLVYNGMKDKDIQSVLSIFKPKIKRVEILKLTNERAVENEILKNICKDLDIPCKDFINIDANENYFVFGSFFTVEKFLRLKGIGK